MRRLAPLAISLLLPACSAGPVQSGPSGNPASAPPSTVGGSTPASAPSTKPYVSKGPVISGVTQREAWIAWETVEPRGQGCGEGAPRLVLQAAGHDGGPSKGPPNPPGKAPASFEDPRCGTLHHVHLSDLAPGTAYTFTLDHGKAHGGPVEGRFSTAPSDPEASFRFVVYGDNRDAPPTQPSTRPNHEAVAAAILAHERDAALLLHTGDLALNDPPHHGYQEFFDVERALLSSRPILPAIGNHETYEIAEFDGLVNAASFAGAEHPYYGGADWGGVHFVIIDTFEPRGVSPAQLAWLETDLAAADQAGKLVFAVTHQGPYSHCVQGGSCHGGLPKERGHDALVKILTAHHVAAIFSGHDHYYQRGREGAGCLQYLVVGGGGAPMYDPAQPGPDAPGVLFAKKLTSYVAVTVKGHSATFETKGTDGAVIDSGVLAPAATGPCPP